MFETIENYTSEYIENSIKEKMQQESLSELLVKFADGYVKCEMQDGSVTHSKVELVGSGNKIVELNLPIAPVGSIIMAVTKAGILGYLPCDGASYNKTSYPKLYEAIGDTFGSDELTFKVPDLRNEFIRGASQTRALGTKEAEDFHPLHVAGITGTGGAWATGTNVPQNGAVVTMGTAGGSGDWYAWKLNYDKTSSENRPQNMAVNFYIKY